MNLTISNSALAQTMTSKDLYDVVCLARVECGETQPRLNDFHARIVDELEGDHYETFVVQNPNKTESTFYRLTIEQCTLVGMRESKAVRRAVLDKLKSLEAKQAPAIPQTYAEALQLAADQAKQLEEQAPKIEVYNRLAERTGDVSTTVVAKQLGTTAVKLNAWLRDKGMKWKNADLPMAGYMDWFNVISDVKNGHEFTQCLVTPKGQIEIAKRWESS